MFGVGKIPSSCWKGMYMISIDHKSGYYHVLILPECWKYFGVSWEDKIDCYVTLSFGWAPSAFIYCSLTGACSTFTRKIMLYICWDRFWIGLTMSFQGPVTWLKMPLQKFSSHKQIEPPLYWLWFFLMQGTTTISQINPVSCHRVAISGYNSGFGTSNVRCATKKSEWSDRKNPGDSFTRTT